jgi:hypothetical protein
VIKSTQTKTIGKRPDDYTIVSLIVGESNCGWGETDDYITLNVLKYNNGVMSAIQQHISLEDLEGLRTILYSTSWDYERRQREKKAEAAAKAEAQGIGSEKAEA